jgi:hypothetical protein
LLSVAKENIKSGKTKTKEYKNRKEEIKWRMGRNYLEI